MTRAGIPRKELYVMRNQGHKRKTKSVDAGRDPVVQNPIKLILGFNVNFDLNLITNQLRF